MDIGTIEGEENIWVSNANGDVGIHNTEGDDQVVEYAGIKIGDYVTYRMVQGMYVLDPVTAVTGMVTKTLQTEHYGSNYDTIALDGTNYMAFGGLSKLGNKLETQLSQVEHGQMYKLYLTGDNRYVGFEKTSGGVSMDTTTFMLGSIIVKEKDQYGKTTFVTKARGIDMGGSEVMLPIGKAMDTSAELIVIGSRTEVFVSCDGSCQNGTPVDSASDITGAGKYYLTADLSENITVSGSNVELCLNGHSINGTATVSGGQLSLTNCASRSGGNVTGGLKVNGGKAVLNDAVFATGVTVASGATIKMTGGKIINNTATGALNGGGVALVSSAKGEFTGGEIKGNACNIAATEDLIVSPSSSYKIAGATIEKYWTNGTKLP